MLQPAPPPRKTEENPPKPSGKCGSSSLATVQQQKELSSPLNDINQSDKDEEEKNLSEENILNYSVPAKEEEKAIGNTKDIYGIKLYVVF